MTLASQAGTDVGAAHVLVVDDEPMVREVVSSYLEQDRHTVVAVADGAAALHELDHRPFDLVVLDLMLPTVDGLTVLRELRARGDVPVIVLTARGDEAERVDGLRMGADDYVVKPFSPRELAARVSSVLRRVATEPRPGAVRFGELVVDEATREVRVAESPVELTRRQFDLLAFLARSPRRVFTRRQLLEQVWDSAPEWQDPATVTVHIGHLRQKIEPDPSRPARLVTVRGVGYRFEP
ncbi:response regulator transcription factor [Haloechinothrix sp. YIM 98757]|uniref:Response regulator transcription factor n=1 Tax=Haloechinothrix aidingensis TaxID=2752311 RepID=A0A837ZUL3_9PSEU|nr:response regulator transcription factor [Haloechinothrix aidingensis]MBA0124286.1 response regulator transcription factor [Haloechinothrix aidingensis]